MRHVEQGARPFGDNVRIEMARIHEACPMFISIDLSLKRCRPVLEHLNVRVNLVTTFNAKLVATGGIARVALEGERHARRTKRAPDWRTVKPSGHDETGPGILRMPRTGLIGRFLVGLAPSPTPLNRPLAHRSRS